MTKQNFIEAGSSKKEQNKIAMYLAVRSGDQIQYDPKQLLVINDDYLVERIFVLRDEDEEYQPSYAQGKVVRIEFSDRVNNPLAMEKAPYIMDIHTTLSLSSFEKKLARCNDESEIEDLYE